MLPIGIVAERLREPVWRTRYAIARAGVIPAGRAGRHFLFAEGDIPKIAYALRHMARMVPPSAENRLGGLPATAEAR